MMTTQTKIASATIALHQSDETNQPQAIDALTNLIVDAAIDDELGAALQTADETWRGMVALDEVNNSIVQ